MPVAPGVTVPLTAVSPVLLASQGPIPCLLGVFLRSRLRETHGSLVKRSDGFPLLQGCSHGLGSSCMVLSDQVPPGLYLTVAEGRGQECKEGSHQPSSALSRETRGPERPFCKPKLYPPLSPSHSLLGAWDRKRKRYLRL